MSVSRRDILKGGLAALGFSALPGGVLFAAPKGWRPRGRPNLVLGAVSDTHIRTAWDGKSRYWRFPLKYFKAALEYFRATKVDAVVHCGDFAHRGMAASMQFHADTWREVFGKSGGPVKLFVSGNHDIEGWTYNNFGGGIFPDPAERRKYILGEDTAAKWEEIWREKYNYERPHEALGMKTPGSVYVPSNRQLPDKIRPWEYNGKYHVIKVNSWGYVRFDKFQIYLSETMINEHVEFRPSPDGASFWVCFRNFKIAEYSTDDGSNLNRTISRL